MPGKEPLHFLGRFHIPIGETFAAMAEVIDRDIMSDRRDHILHDLSTGLMEEDVIGYDRRHASGGGQVRKLPEAHLIIRPPPQGQGHIRTIVKHLAQPAKPHGAGLIGAIGYQHRNHALAISSKICPFQMALCLARALLSERQKTTEPCIGWPIHRVNQDRHAIDQIEPTSDDQPNPMVLCRLMRTHDPCNCVAVDNAKRLDAEFFCLSKQFLTTAGPSQEGEVARDLELGIARTAHPKIPCRNHL